MRVLVAYNGSMNSKSAIKQGIRKVRERGGTLIVLYVFHRDMFIDYDAGPGAEREAREEALRLVEEAKKIIADEGKGIWSRVVVTEGNPADEIVRFAMDENIGLIFSPQYYDSIAQRIPCPVFFVPSAAQAVTAFC
jgi:nucleotide-binding universal stress UspA family protein